MASNEKESALKIGVIGLGAVGVQLVSRLLGRTCGDLYVYDPDRRSCAKAAIVCETAAQVCDACAIVFVALESTSDHLALLNGVCEFLHPGSAVVDFTPLSPAQAHQNANVFRRAQIDYLDCAIFSPDTDLDSPFLCFVGGSGAVFSRLCPLLRCIAPDCRHMGPAGRGHAARMLCLSLAAGLERELTHTAELAEQIGIERAYFLDALTDFSIIARPLAALAGEPPAFLPETLKQGERIAQEMRLRLRQKNSAYLEKE